jgi:hypothetical protein
MPWIEIDPNEPGYCGACLSEHLIEDMDRALEMNPQKATFSGRCVYCGQPTGPLRPYDPDEITRGAP